MSERMVWRLAAASGILYVAVGLAHGGGGGPDPGASRTDIASWVGSSLGPRGVNWMGAYLAVLGLLCFVVFTAVLAAAIRRREGAQPWLSNVILGAGLITVTVKLASFPAAFALAYRAHEGFEPQLAAALTDMNNLSFILTWPLSALMIGAAAAGILRYGALPAWLGWLGVAVAIALFASVPFAFGQGAFVAFITSSLWVVLASATMVARPIQDVMPGSTRQAAVALPPAEVAPTAG
ncbi:MAG TPA: hypothetical protein VN906_05760 [Candidatus Sulfotelmatobacter sp.]|nr:hypothetical protein [Candidatus Sulfotelmatobacter sp.]